ncbi:BnaC03g21730D [Brassica napus]|uniref:BnaC03g21730D protein n=1 Tax=Brassica napus TaxID=3708 RepID=A0A078FNH2_BRANA|nr:BnaC03g21730D [Brassica napus]
MANTTTSPDGDGGESGGSVREHDRYLPIANISRIMKRALPPNGKIGKDAKDTVQECVSEFISFITSEASDKCQKEKRKTVNGEDLLWAMSTLGFEDYLEPLKVYLARYREVSYISLLLLSSCYVRLILSFHLPVYVAETILLLHGDSNNRDAAGGVSGEELPVV